MRWSLITTANGLLGCKQLQGGGATGGFGDRELIFDQSGQNLEVLGLVVDHQDPTRCRQRHPERLQLLCP